MTDITVSPGALRAFAADCRGTAVAMDAIPAGTAATGVSAGLPQTVTAAACASAGADLEAAFAVVATRHRTMADIADGTRDDYDVTEDEIVGGFGRMSHR